MCPHWFRWNGWYYFIGGVDGIFRSREPYGPWTRQWPGRLDNLSVPKTGAFTGNRRIFAGFLNDDGWGGNLVMRDLVQHDDGTLSTRFVPEMIPACGEPLALKNAATPVLLEPKQGRRQLLFDAIPNDVSHHADARAARGQDLRRPPAHHRRRARRHGVLSHPPDRTRTLQRLHPQRQRRTNARRAGHRGPARPRPTRAPRHHLPSRSRRRGSKRTPYAHQPFLESPRRPLRRLGRRRPADRARPRDPAAESHEDGGSRSSS